MANLHKDVLKKGKAKRRASDASEIFVSTAFEAARAQAKRVKREPSETRSVKRSSPSAPPVSPLSPPASSPTSGKDGEDRARVLVSPPRNQSSMTPEHDVLERAGFENACAESQRMLQIFGGRYTTSNAFRKLVGQVVDHGLTSWSKDDPEPPGVSCLSHVGEFLKRSSHISAARAEKVDSMLKEALRTRMAAYLGKQVSNSAELREVVSTIVSSLPYRTGLTGYYIHLPGVPALKQSSTAENARPADADASTSTVYRGQSDVDSSNQRRKATNALAVQSSSASEPRSSSVTAVTDRQLMPPPPDFKLPAALQQISSIGGDEVPSLETSSKPAVRDASQTPSPKKRSQKNLSTLTYQAARHFLSPIQFLLWDQALNDTFSLKAHEVYNSLTAAERAQWRDVRKWPKSTDGTAFDEIVLQLLKDQDICGKFGAIPQSASTSIPSISPKPLFKPVLVPYPTPPRGRSSSCILLVVNTPDVPCMDGRGAELHEACRRAFGDASNFLGVEQRTRHVWVAKFGDRTYANGSKGKLIWMHGFNIAAEHHYPGPPKVFIYNTSDGDVEQEEMAFRIAQAFKENTCTPLFRVQEARKLYDGKQFTVTFARPPQLVRIYVPVRRSGTDVVFMACFKPLNPKANCALCGDRHGFTPCEHSKTVTLPVMD